MINCIGEPQKIYRVICIDYNGCDGQYETYCDDVFSNYSEAVSFVRMMNARFRNYSYPRYRMENG